MNINSIGSVELTIHRVFWGAITLSVYFFYSKPFRKKTLSHLKSKKELQIIFISTLLIGVNWGVFIYSVQSKQLIAASLGYFISPLFNVFLGKLIFKERLSPFKILAVILAGIGIVFFMQEGFGNVFITVGLFVTFGLYGALRKSAKTITPLSGLFWEMIFVAVPGMLYLFVYAGGPLWPMQTKASEVYLVPFAGLVTILPLFWFNIAVKELRFSTVGILQYLAPTLQFLVGYLILKEEVTNQKLIAFAFVWVALFIYSYDLISQRNKRG